MEKWNGIPADGYSLGRGVKARMTRHVQGTVSLELEILTEGELEIRLER